MVFGAVRRLRFIDPRDRALTVLPVASLVRLFIPSTRCDKPRGLSKDSGELTTTAFRAIFSLLQIARVEAFGEPAVDRSEKIASLIPLTLIAPEPRHTNCSA